MNPLKQLALIILAAMAFMATMVDWRMEGAELGLKVHDTMYHELEPIDATGCKEGQRHKPDEWVNRCGFAEPK